MQMYLKRSPSFSRAFTNCFMMPSFMWRRGNAILERSTKGGARTLKAPGISSLRTGQSFFYPLLCSCRAVPQTQEARKFCVARGETQPFSNRHRIHWCCLYEIFSRTNLISSYFSLRVVEWPRGTDPYKLPLWRTHFKLPLELSINRCQSSESYCLTPSCRSRPAMSLQYTMSFSWVKYGKN